MASIAKEPNGRRRILFVAPDGKRRTIRLGKVSDKAAQAVKVKVEALVSALITGHPPDDETSRWVANLDQRMIDRLAAVALVPKREAATLGAFVDAYLVGRIDLKPRTHLKLNTTRCVLVDFYGAGRLLRDVTAGDADDFRLHLVGQRLAENTVRKHVAIAKQFFHAAVRKRIIATNPFADLRSTVQPNPARFYFVTRAEVQRVIDTCPDAEWRLLVALSRYGGLRCPSEHVALRWGDVDWERGRITITSPKTEHHEGHGSRVVPMFPELRPYLEEAWDRAEPGTEYVITMRRNSNANLRTRLEKIIRRAGLTPWPKLFQNQRSSRQTELEESFPSHVVCAWMGNSRSVAAKHYLQVTDEHFRQAVVLRSGTNGAAQNPAQQPAEFRRTALHGPTAPNEKALVLQGLAEPCVSVQLNIVAAEGLEPPTRGL